MSLRQYIPFLGPDGNDGYDDSQAIKIAQTNINEEYFDILLDRLTAPAEYILAPLNPEDEELYSFSPEDIITQDSLGSLTWISPGVKFAFLKSWLEPDSSALSAGKKRLQTAYLATAVVILSMLSILLGAWLGMGYSIGVLFIFLGIAVLYYYKTWQKEHRDDISKKLSSYAKFIEDYLRRYFFYGYGLIAAGGILLAILLILKFLGK